MFRFSRLIGCYVVLFAFCIAQIGSATAQAPVHEPIVVVHAGIDRLHVGLDYVFGLADEPKHLKTLKDTLEVFFVGVDKKRPVVVGHFEPDGEPGERGGAFAADEIDGPFFVVGEIGGQDPGPAHRGDQFLHLAVVGADPA